MNSQKNVKSGLDRLPEAWPAELAGAPVGLVAHPASIASDLRHAVQVFQDVEKAAAGVPPWRLQALFGPQHGLLGETQDNMVEWEGGEQLDPRWGLPVHSLYGQTREPSSAMLKGLEALVVDLQDVGARYYTYIWSLYLSMRACEKAGVAVVVLDRPNPIGGDLQEGPVLELDHTSFVGLHSIPIRHGRTIGELARQFREEVFPNCNLFVVEMEGWEDRAFFDATSLPWVAPSPNMPTLDTAIVYPGMCLLEACNLSEGRGTTRPFEWFGAPWLEAPELVDHLNGLKMPGVEFREHHFLPTFHKYAQASIAGWEDEVMKAHCGSICHGAQIHVNDRESFRPFAMAVEILRYAWHRHPEHFRWRPAEVGYEYEFEKPGIDMLLGCGWFRQREIEGKQPGTSIDVEPRA
jgi:uncharacterized protein YbbC (DUF1343 family)